MTTSIGRGFSRCTKDIDGSQLTQPIGTKTKPFTGQLDGQDHTISNLSQCLVKKLAGNGRINGLRFIGANITSTAPAGVAACEMSGDAIVSNIQVERAYLVTECRYWLDKDICAGIDHHPVTSDCLAADYDTLNGTNTLLTPPVTETVATVPVTTMALPTSSASLITGAIAGITLGAAAFVVAGVCFYYHYHRRSSPTTAVHSQELVTINTSQKANDQPMEAVRS